MDAIPSCFDSFSTEGQKVYITPLYNAQNRQCQCVCPPYNTSSWIQSGNNTGFSLGNTVLVVLGILFLVALARQSLRRMLSEQSIEKKRREFCCRDVKDRIRTVLCILENKELEVRDVKEQLKFTEKQLRCMKLMNNQAHAVILCRMEQLMEAYTWLENYPPCKAIEATSVQDSSSSTDAKAKITILDEQIDKLSEYKNRQTAVRQSRR
ncbi:hypothetical protein WDU94_013584 [Cyamophila willieti]